MTEIEIGKINLNPDNPRTINAAAFKTLKNSVNEFDVMLEMRPIIVDESYTIIGGNMRYRAMQELNYKKVRYNMLTEKMIEKAIAKYQTLGKKKNRQDIIDEVIIKDNVTFGEWDDDMLANNFHELPLTEWNMEVPVLNAKAEIEDQEIVFSEYLEESHNYVVLLFDNDIDWLSAQTHFDLKSVYSKRANGKTWSKGIGRVVNGAEYLKSQINE